MPLFDITTYGEGGLRLSVPVGERLRHANLFDVHIAGAEGNVAGGLSYLGWKAGWISSLPKSPTGELVANTYRRAGMNLEAVHWVNEGRVGIYFVEYAKPPRPIKVYYDRKNTCFTQMTHDKIDWDYLLDTRILHLTGITVPLHENCQTIIMEALQKAGEKGVLRSFDVNYRSLLWEPEVATTTLSQIIRHVDILFCGRRDAELIFGCQGEPDEIIEQLRAITSATYIVVSLGSGGVIGWDGTQIIHIPGKNVEIVDRIGAGDGMVVGVLHGLLQNDFHKGLRYGALTATLAMSQHGDMLVTDVDELESLIDKDPIDIQR